MARETDRYYMLKKDDSLFGSSGRIINQDVFDVLPEISKNKFKERGGRIPRIAINHHIGGTFTTATVGINPFAPQAQTHEGIDLNDLEDENDEDYTDEFMGELANNTVDTLDF